MSQHTIRTLEQLQALYSAVSEASIRKTDSMRLFKNDSFRRME